MKETVIEIFSVAPWNHEAKASLFYHKLEIQTNEKNKKTQWKPILKNIIISETNKFHSTTQV